MVFFFITSRIFWCILIFYIPPVWWSPLMSWLSMAAWRRFFRWVTPGQLGALLVIIPTLEMCSHHLPVPRRILELSIGILKYYEYVYIYIYVYGYIMIYLWMYNIYIYIFIYSFIYYIWNTMNIYEILTSDICWHLLRCYKSHDMFIIWAKLLTPRNGHG